MQAQGDTVPLNWQRGGWRALFALLNEHGVMQTAGDFSFISQAVKEKNLKEAN